MHLPVCVSMQLTTVVIACEMSCGMNSHAGTCILWICVVRSVCVVRVVVHVVVAVVDVAGVDDVDADDADVAGVDVAEMCVRGV